GSGPPILRAAAALEGRIARVLLATAQPRCQAVSRATPRTAAERVRPETDRERSERWLLEGREYHNLPDNWDALVQQQQWRAASQASSRPESPVADESADGSGLLRGTELTPRTAAMVGGRPGAASWRAATGTTAGIRALARLRVLGAFSDGAGLMNTSACPGPPLATCPADRGSTNFHGASLAAAPGCQKQQPQQQAKSSKGVNFDTDVMVAMVTDPSQSILDQEQLLRDSKPAAGFVAMATVGNDALQDRSCTTCREATTARS
uniref:WW domain-containing protein n=1 Tax=Macrostomum lignano TaxID=282301 RepID=A0A1I8FKP2_9PLAT